MDIERKESIFYKFERILNYEIKRVEENFEEDKKKGRIDFPRKKKPPKDTNNIQRNISGEEDDDYEIFDDAESPEKYYKIELRYRRKEIIKTFYATLQEMLTYMSREYKQELMSSKWYEKAWVEQDERIQKTLKKYPYIKKTVDFIDKKNHYLRGKEYQQMVAEVYRLTGGMKYTSNNGSERDYAVFVTDKNFYRKITAELECSKINIQKYLQTFCKYGIIKKLCDVGREGTLYADGYYVPYEPDKIRKIRFLKKSPEFIKALRNFKPRV
jgi:hypothetical protein